jgi:hypothetical protein
MSDLWRVAQERSAKFDANAVAYDQYRPRYPAALFDDIMVNGELQPGMGVMTLDTVSRLDDDPVALARSLWP